MSQESMSTKPFASLEEAAEYAAAFYMRESAKGLKGLNVTFNNDSSPEQKLIALAEVCRAIENGTTHLVDLEELNLSAECVKNHSDAAELLKQLPEPFRTQALSQLGVPETMYCAVETLSEAVREFRSWADTKEGQSYWNAVFTAIQNWEHGGSESLEAVLTALELGE